MSTEQTPTPSGAPDPTAVLTVPLNPDGTVGTLPEPLQKLFDARIREATARAKARAVPDPVEAQDVVDLRRKVEQYEQDDLARQKRYDEALQKERDRAAKDAEKWQAEIDRRTERLRRSVQADIKAAALAAGARDESIDELVALLAPKVSLNDDLDPVVDGADSIDALVVGYLDAKPHHRRAIGGQSMGTTGTRGGAVPPGIDADRAAILARIQKQGKATGKDFAEMAALRVGGRT